MKTATDETENKNYLRKRDYAVEYNNITKNYKTIYDDLIEQSNSSQKKIINTYIRLWRMVLDCKQNLLSGKKDTKEYNQFADLYFRMLDAAMAVKEIIIHQLKGSMLKDFYLLSNIIENQQSTIYLKYSFEK